MSWAGVELIEDWLVVCCTYNPSFIASLKEKVPSKERFWNSAERVWRIRPSYSFALAGLLSNHFDRTRYYYRTEDQPNSPEEKALAAMYLRVGAPPGLIDVAYRFLAKHWHPDLAGEGKQVEATDRMAGLNDAYSLLRKGKAK